MSQAAFDPFTNAGATGVVRVNSADVTSAACGIMAKYINTDAISFHTVLLH